MNIVWKKSAIKDMERLDKPARRRVWGEIHRELPHNPHAGKKLKGGDEAIHRVRVGDYRVIYKIFDAAILIIAIGHRKDVYRKF